LIANAAQKQIADSKEKVIDLLFEKRIATRKLAEASYLYADIRDGLNPRSYWGMVQGMTAQARDIPFYDKRMAVQKSASKLIDMAA
jgi:hypothetical protein